jgi:serine/threonine-protein kinase
VTGVGDGRFELGPVLGRGAVSVVYRATEVASGRPCAIKVFNPSMEEVRSQGARFDAEANVLRVLRHPHLVPVYAHGTKPFRWLAMELMEGGSLEDRVAATGALTPERATGLVMEVLLGLAAVHQAGLVHRDVKPSNVLLGLDGHARLADFGHARHPRGSVDFATKVGIAMGSPGYQAPETGLDAASASARSDVYSAGALLFYVVTSESPRDLYRHELDESVIRVAPAWSRGVIATATRRDPAGRYVSASEMGRALALVRDRVLGTAEAPRWAERFGENMATRRRLNDLKLKLSKLLKLR